MKRVLVLVSVLFLCAELKAQSQSSSLQDTLQVKKNPYNPLMGIIPAKDYSENIMSYIDEKSSSVPYFKPAVFVKSKKAKFSTVPVVFTPKVTLKALPLNRDILGYWETANKVGLDINQISFVNWSAGGDNSISGIFKADIAFKYIKGRLLWTNTINMRYGINKQSDRELRKSDDVFDYNSSFGYKSGQLSDWYYMAKLNFKTQFTDGFSYPNTDESISGPFAPAYLFVGLGAEYIMPKSKMQFYFSPLTYKATFVSNQRLANLGSFGVEGAVYDEEGNMLKKGQRSRAEFGFLISNEWKKEIMKNITLNHKISLYSDYVDHFGNIDVAWEMKLDLVVNKFVQASVGTNLIYDDSIKTNVEIDGVQVMEGPRVQFKQTLGVGIVYTF